MDPAFWHERWESGQLGFHLTAVNPLLVAHLDALGPAPGSRLFLPLCGKTVDIPWLLAQGYRVAGAELSPIAVEQLFAEMGVEPDRATPGVYRADGLDVFVGDVFDLTRAALGPVDATFDRAALVALPPDVRARYAAHLTAITGRAPQLLVTFEYDQAEMAGPPFSVPADEIGRHYAGDYDVELLARAAPIGGLRGLRAVSESVWLLSPRPATGPGGAAAA